MAFGDGILSDLIRVDDRSRGLVPRILGNDRSNCRRPDISSTNPNPRGFGSK